MLNWISYSVYIILLLLLIEIYLDELELMMMDELELFEVDSHSGRRKFLIHVAILFVDDFREVLSPQRRFAENNPQNAPGSRVWDPASEAEIES